MKGVLLINLGTPSDYQPNSVRRFLKEFLNDERVFDLPASLRWPLVNLFIIPRRYKKTAAAYQKIWDPLGSPLLVNGKLLAAALEQELGPGYKIALGMRYGEPSIGASLASLEDCHSLKLVPLFPQYSSAANGSALEKSLALVGQQWNVPDVTIVRDFFNHPGYINAYAALIRKKLTGKKTDCLVFSYHGLPLRQVKKSCAETTCDHKKSCPAMNTNNLACYRAQCYASSALIAQELGLDQQQYKVAFQSRLGRTPWIKPYTDLLLPELYKQGVRDIAIVCPSFVADCLETLEEVQIRAREQWQKLGGSSFTFIPCLNDDKLWIKALADIVR